MDLDAIELVLRTPVAGVRLDEAGVLVGVVGALAAGGEAGLGGGFARRPALEGPAHLVGRRHIALDAQLRVGERQYLPDDLAAGGGVGHRRAEGHLAQRRVLGGGHRPLPHVEVHDEGVVGGQPVTRLLLVAVAVGLVPVVPERGRFGGGHPVVGVGGGGVLVGHRVAGGRAGRVAQYAVDVVVAAMDVQGVEVGGGSVVLDAEARVAVGAERAAVLTDQVDGGRARLVELDRGLLVGVRVELDPALLGDDRRVVPRGPEGGAGDVCVHEGCPPGSEVCGSHVVGGKGAADALGCGSAQVTKKIPASVPAGTYSARRARRLSSRCGRYRSWKAPISAPSSAPRRISSAHRSASSPYQGSRSARR